MPERDSNPHGHSPADVLIESLASLAVSMALMASTPDAALIATFFACSP
jgi:hypothetical protein